MNTQKQTQVQYQVINEDRQGQRLDNFLIASLKGLPKSHIYRIIRKGEVRVNKKRAKPDYRLRTGDIVRLPPLTISERTQINNIPDALLQRFKERVLYESDTLVILNKPIGIPVHGGTEVSLSVIDVARKLWPHSKNIELAHRLDKETSGCLILAKKRSALRIVHSLLREGKVHKKYIVLVKGQWKGGPKVVELALQKNQLQSGERMVFIDEQGKKAKTTFTPLQIFPKVSLLEADIETGRTHQIRVHAASLGHPVVGDEKYGDHDFNKQAKKLGFKRMFLHAHSIEFQWPEDQKIISVATPLDPEFAKAIEGFSNETI